MISLESNEKLAPDELMSKWYEDLIEYNPKEPDENKYLSSTQIIWKDSKKFGIGYYYVPFIQDKNDVGKGNIITKQKKYCYIALYYPAGNQFDKNKYKTNVLNVETNIKKLKNKIKEENKEETQLFINKEEIKDNKENIKEDDIFKIVGYNNLNENEIGTRKLNERKERKKFQEESTINIYNKGKNISINFGEK